MRRRHRAAGLVATGFLLFVVLLGRPRPGLSQACSLQTNFHPSLNATATVYTVVALTNGQVLIGGAFTSAGQFPAANVARLNADGSPDTIFNPGPAVDRGYVTALAVQPDGRIVVGGSFYSSVGVAQAYLTRLNADGSVDAAFDQNIFVDGTVNALLLQGDGKIVLGGSFSIVNFYPRRTVARLNADGTLDTSFDACIASTAGAGATALALDSTGRIFAGGAFTFSTGLARDGVARLGTNGDVDTAYDPQPGVNPGATVYAIALRDDGKILLGGDFGTFQSSQRRGLVQLTDSGAIDAEFEPGTGLDAGGTVYALALQNDGKVVVAGDFPSYNGQPRNRLARIHPHGGLDVTCEPSLGPDNAVAALAMQSDGRILVAGRFGSFNGAARRALARLRGEPAPCRLSPPNRLGDGTWQFTLFGEDQARYGIEISPNLVDWQSLTNLTAMGSATPFIDSNTNSPPGRFYRGVSLP